MPKNTWTVLDSATDITSRILSMSITQGREKYLDTYSGGQCVITINNSGDYASTIEYGSVLHVSCKSSPTAINEFYCDFWVQRIDFHDYPGNTGLNTATITAVDWIGRAGRINADNYVIIAGNTGFQIDAFKATSGGPLPADMLVGASGDSLTSGSTYSGSVNNYLNYLVTTERNYVVPLANVLWFPSRSLIATFSIETTELGRTTSTTQIAYQQFERIQNGLQFINTASVSPAGLATQTVVNASSVSTYGGASYSSSTVDSTTTQAAGNAGWVANTFSDPSSLRFVCSWSDVAQNQTALQNFMKVFANYFRLVNINYTVPGGSTTKVACLIEGYTIDVTPEQTFYRMSFSPLQYYQFFTLNSSTLGILDTSRLGW